MKFRMMKFFVDVLSDFPGGGIIRVGGKCENYWISDLARRSSGWKWCDRESRVY